MIKSEYLLCVLTIVIHFSKLRSSCNIVSLWCLMLWNTCERHLNSFNLKFFASITPPWTSSSFLSQSFYSYILITISINSIYLMLLISLSVIAFHLFASLVSLLSHSLFQLSIFTKCHIGLFLWDKEEAQLHALLPVWTMWTDIQWSITNRLGKKWCEWPLIMTYISCFYSRLCIGEWAVNIVLNTSTPF